ncbi:transglutaminase [Candidatus Poribacteria bacterium]|nr:MAG: transglutaminase [Candidatus Poribacteria bacterium]
MNYKITHNTQYSYSSLVNLCHNEARLTPRSFAQQICTQSEFTVDPEPTSYRERKDFFGNTVCYFTIQHPHQDLSVTVTSHVEVKESQIDMDIVENIVWETVQERLHTDQNAEILEIRQYIFDSPMIQEMPELHAYAESSFVKDRPLIEAVEDLINRLFKDFAYDPGFTTVATPLAEVIKHRRGVCQDFAHLGIGCLRSMGLAARYVSGYIETVAQPNQEQLIGADASHAWFSVYLPDIGWIDFDPTNNQIPTNQHITVAWGRDYTDVAPLKGVVFGSGTHELSVSVDCRTV